MRGDGRGREPRGAGLARRAHNLPTVGPVERALALRSLPLFHALRARQLAILARHTRECTAARGSILMRAGERVRTIYLLGDGRVRPRHGDRLAAPLQPPVAVGLLQVLADEPARAGAVADTDVSALVLDGAALLDIIEEDFALLLHVHATLSAEVAALQARLGCYRTAAAAARAEPLPPRPAALDLVHRLLALQRAPDLRRLGVGVLAGLLRDHRELRLAAGEALFTAGAEAPRFFVLVDGEVECAAADGAPLFRARAGELLGREAALTGTPHPFGAVARGPVTAIGLEAPIFWDLAEDHFHVARSALAACARQLLELEARADADATAPQPVSTPPEARP